MTYDLVKFLSTNSLISLSKERKLLTVMLCIVILAIAFVATEPENVLPQELKKATIYIDTSGIDAWATAHPGQLTPQQISDLKNKILLEVTRNLESAVGVGNVEVTNNATKEKDAIKKVKILNERHTPPAYGSAPRGGKEATVYLGEFMDVPGRAPAYQTDNQWNPQKLGNALGHTASHELGHLFGASHNTNEGDRVNKMTTNEGSPTGRYGDTDKATRGWTYGTGAKKAIRKNWSKIAITGGGPCPPAKEVAIHYWGQALYASNLEESHALDALFNLNGSLASYFEFGFLGPDSDGGATDGNPQFDFIYQSSVEELGEGAEMLTFFVGTHDYLQFLLVGAPGSPYEGQWFLLPEGNLHLYNFVTQPDGHSVARLVVMEWDIDGIPGIDVQVTLDSNAFGEYSNPYNGFTYEYRARVSCVSLSPASITTDPPVSFTVDINVADVTDLRAWDIQIRWNPQIISFVSIAEGPFLNDTGATELLYNVYIGYILSAACTIKGAGGSSGTGRLATVTFACYDTGDAFNITVESSTLLDSDNVEIVHIASGVLVQTQSPVVKSSRKVTTDVSGQRANDQNPAPGDTVRFDARESYAQPKLVGDVDRSGRTDIGDSNLIGVNWFKTEGTGMLWDADIDRSGRVDLADSNLVGKYWFNVGGKIANFTWNFGDGTVVFGKDKSVVTHVFADYSDADGYTVILTVKDGVGREWFKTKQVKIWRDFVAVDIWPCYDDYLGTVSVMPDEDMPAGTILFPTGAYGNFGTLKQNVTIATFLMNTATKENMTLVAQYIKNKGPDAKSNLWGVPYYTWTGIEINDPNMTATLATNAKLMFVDYDLDGAYTVAGCERPIWDTDSSGTVTVGDIDCTAGAVIGALDADIGTALTLDAQLKWVDNDADGAFDIGERVYYDTDASGTVNAGDYYVWLESFYYGVVYDVQIFAVPTGSYQFVMTVTSAQPDLDLTNNEFVYSPIFNVP